MRKYWGLVSDVIGDDELWTNSATVAIANKANASVARSVDGEFRFLQILINGQSVRIPRDEMIRLINFISGAAADELIDAGIEMYFAVGNQSTI